MRLQGTELDIVPLLATLVWENDKQGAQCLSVKPAHFVVHPVKLDVDRVASDGRWMPAIVSLDVLILPNARGVSCPVFESDHGNIHLTETEIPAAADVTGPNVCLLPRREEMWRESVSSPEVPYSPMFSDFREFSDTSSENVYA